MYRIVGADGRQYGPVSADQIRRWIAEGRANAQTQALAEGAAEWKPLSAIPEFAGSFIAPHPPAIYPITGGQPRITNSFALWGMIFGILSFICCLCCCLNIPLGALGLIFSLTGLMQINEHPHYYEGRIMAITGIVLSALALIIGVALMFANMANGNFHHHYYWHYQHFN
jgi:GYF domain 2/Domain of unknown function (DUF4190)